MKIVIFTGNALRHKYIANILGKNSDDVLVVSECIPRESEAHEGEPTLIKEYFASYDSSERVFFRGHEMFKLATFPIVYKEINLPFVHDAVKEFNPDAAFVFGSSIIKEPLLSLIPRGRFVNLHLGLSPYYRGSKTNFWPLANNEPEYVGATLLHIDAGIDTGDIIAHIRLKITEDDTAHTAGFKTIIESGATLLQVLDMLKKKDELPRVKQWACPDAKVYKKNDFNEEALKKYYDNLRGGMMKRYVEEGGKNIKFVSLL